MEEIVAVASDALAVSENDLLVPPVAYTSSRKPYNCAHFWSKTCIVQCGDHGVIFRCVENGGNYKTAFFEAFARDPDTFIRGEGATIADAEEDAWAKYSRTTKCSHPSFERRGYTNGLGFCTDCGMSKSKAFEPSTVCCICGIPTWHTVDEKGKHYCEPHADQVPEADLTRPQRWMRFMDSGGDEEDYEPLPIGAHESDKYFSFG